MDTWTIRKVLDWTKGHFDKQQVDSPRLTAELLLAHTLKADRVKLYVDLDRPLEPDELAAFKALIQRRLTGEPTQYLVGYKEFYGRRFMVDARVLIPRSETELLVEAVLRATPKDRPFRVLDLCTGSGCVAITIAAERPQASVWATDLSAGALAVARDNAERLGVGARVTFLEGDLFTPVPPSSFDVIVSNPPYVRSSEIPRLQREVQREPRAALDGGADGLDVIRRIVAGLATPSPQPTASWGSAGTLLALELGDDQGPAVRELLERAGLLEVRVEKDLARHDRLAFGRLPPGTPRADPPLTGGC